jgi:DNA gyrase inhibitor GyrI
VALIALGVSGGIGAYKAVEVCRGLQQRGHDVVAVMTRSAARFVGPVTFVEPGDEAALNAAVTAETAAVILEPIQGEGGVRPLTSSFAAAVSAACARTGALLVCDFDYYIAVSSDKSVPDGMEEFVIPAATWAVFECVGAMPEAIQTLQKRVVTEWLPSSGYEYADAPDIELYFEGDQSADDYKCEVWLPVVKK